MTSAPDQADGDVMREVREAWAELLSAARQAGYAVSELVRPPAGAGQLAAAEEAIGRRLPPDLAVLYQLSDGQAEWSQLVIDGARERGRWVGSLFGEGWTFSSLEQLQTDYRGWADLRAIYTPAQLTEEFDDMIEVRGNDPVKPVYTCADWIPFATDGAGNSLAADLAPEPGGSIGQVIVIGPDEGLRRVLAPSVLALLRLCASRLRQPDAIEHNESGVALYTLEPRSAG